ncbi:MAG: MotA/TolQ/ExbB proton channel family protein [Spirochaetota bacterium]
MMRSAVARACARAGLVTVLLLLASVVALGQNGAGDGGASRGDGQENESSQTDPLVSAYQREFVFLDNEIRLLEQRLEEVRAEGEDRVAASRARLEELEAELIRLDRAVDSRQEDLRTAEQEAADTQDADTALEQVLQQGTSRLEEYGVPSFPEATEEDLDGLTSQERLLAELGYVFDEAFGTLERLGSIRNEEGSFFLEDGREVEGSLVHVGRIGSFGASEEAAGTLAPAGSGRLRLVDEETAQTARSLAEEGVGASQSLPIFLYESLDELVEVRTGTTLRESVEAAGVIGIVIIAIGAVALLFILLRVASLVVVGRGNRRSIGGIAGLVQEGKFQEAYQAAKSLPGAKGRVLATTVKGLEKDPSSIEDLISESVLNEQPALDRFRSALGVFAAVAPLLGLLGTVTGMIATFDVITQYGTGDPGLLSGGISEALITTEFGLVVAIPTLLIGNLLAAWSDRITSNLEVSALRLVNVSVGYESAAAERARA